MDISTQSFDEGKYIWYTPSDQSYVFLKGRVKKIDRMYQTAIIVPVDENMKDDRNAKEVNLPLANLQSASTGFHYSYLLSNLKIVNNPELMNYFRWVISTGVQYCYLNRSLFFINTTNKVINRINVPLCNNIIHEDYLDIMEKDPHMSVFLSKILFSMQSEGTSKLLFLLGKKNSAKSVHFNFTLEYLETMFLSGSPEIKARLKSFMTIIKALTNCVNNDGHMESFSFAIYKFFFDSSMNLVGFTYRLIALYITFLTSEKQISRQPLLFYLTKAYFDSQNVNYPHLDALYRQNLVIGKESKVRFKEFEKDVFEAFKVN